ncbi:AGAP004132-PA-like protein [Anopheles sinensis]|uniref:AGAP004132-PA-like protein n=1 Tax=Anopheles sinensis TaxID=74873 RepID=A0A084VL95_ANOSI|nr:AGAP004132-PA-like protein [Anopheles sinensis]
MARESDRLLRPFVPLVFVLLVGLARAQLDTFDYCIRMTPSPGLLRCAGQQALTSLQFLEEANNFTLASGLLMIKDESLAASSRIIPNIIDSDPLDFRQVPLAPIWAIGEGMGPCIHTHTHTFSGVLQTP